MLPWQLLEGFFFVHFISQCPSSPGEEEQGSMAEVSYYSYDYGPDSEPFLADADGGDHFDFPDRGGDVAQKLFPPTDIQPPTLDTKNTPERWYDSPHRNTRSALLLCIHFFQLRQLGLNRECGFPGRAGGLQTRQFRTWTLLLWNHAGVMQSECGLAAPDSNKLRFLWKTSSCLASDVTAHVCGTAKGAGCQPLSHLIRAQEFTLIFGGFRPFSTAGTLIAYPGQNLYTFPLILPSEKKTGSPNFPCKK